RRTANTKPPYTVTGIIIHKLAASLFKPRGSKRGKKVAAYSPENTVILIPTHFFGFYRLTNLYWSLPYPQSGQRATQRGTETSYYRLVAIYSLRQRSSTGGPRPPGGPWRYCRGSAKLFHLKHFSLFQKLKTSNRLHKHKQNVKIAFYSLKIIHRLPIIFNALFCSHGQQYNFVTL